MPTRNPRRHGRELSGELQSLRHTRRIPVGIDPDLVFKIKAANTRLNDGALLPRGLVPLGETADYLYFVLAHDDGAALGEALDRYAAGPDEEGAKGPLYTLFDRVDAIEPYGPDDRRGPGLGDLDPSDSQFTVDVSMWPADDWDEGQRRAGIVENVVSRAGGTVVQRDGVGVRRSVLRVSVNDEGLANLLETSVVERVRTPPVPFIDPSSWQDVSADDLELQVQGGAAVGVIDDAPAAAHPLLRDSIASITCIGPEGYSWPAPSDHGTQVASRVLLPRLEEELRDHGPITAVGTVHVARILEPVPGQPHETRFAGGDAGLPPHTAIERAIRELHKAWGVRIFNLSIGLRDAFDAIHVSELTEVIDELVRELDIVVVVPSGNAPAYGSQTASGHHAQRDYPVYMSTPEHRLTEPGPAALALTVGSIAHSDAPAPHPYRSRLRDEAVAKVGHVSPFSRTGPGIGTAIARLNKPDLVAYGGNWVHDGDMDHIVPEDPGVGVVTAAFGKTGQLFRAACGTSFAVPAVARCAADALDAYPDASANLIRALVAASAREPDGARGTNDRTTRHRLYGFGIPASHRAVGSDTQRVTMTFDGDMVTDTAVIHAIPVPEQFARGRSATRTIQVALAYDPPVRRQRREYLAGTMQMDLYRATDIEDLAETVARQDPDARIPQINGRRRVSHLKPGIDSLRSSTLQVRTWKATTLDVDDGDTYLLAITHKVQTWARNTDYTRQPYALAVTIADEGRTDLDLYTLVTEQLKQTVRVQTRI
ncbi:MAG TPA: S8 family peptidase [Trebonia sp.]|jgi:hypothetical protein